MEVYRSDRGFTVRLDRGEELLQTLTEFVRQEGIAGGTISGIGAVEQTTLGYYDLAANEYRRREFPHESELVSLQGNISWVDGQPLVHAHATISGPDFAAYGGHLFGATVAITGEFFLLPTGVRVERCLDERTGLKLMARAS